MVPTAHEFILSGTSYVFVAPNRSDEFMLSVGSCLWLICGLFGPFVSRRLHSSGPLIAPGTGSWLPVLVGRYRFGRSDEFVSSGHFHR
jgi:hypothetical protein